ncbi:MAG: glycosyltransferase [Clostridium sp.]|nr:glycosyltransferase [Clostridium sp.]
MGKKTVILIPCYNEAKTIKEVIEDFKVHMPHADIYVYDNNSTDGTDKIAREAGAIVRYERRQGKGNVVRSMFRDIDADCYIMVDGDATYPASFAPRLEKLILEDKADLAVGDRLSSTYFTENKRPFHNFGNVLVRRLINTIYHAKLNDIMTGARAFNRDFVKMYPILSKGFEIETEMTIFALENNFRIVEEPIEYKDRPDGSESKLNTFSDGFKVIRKIATLFRDTKPFAFFTIISVLLLIIAGAFFAPILVDFYNTGLVTKLPTLLCVGVLTIIALVNFFCGVILSVLKKQHQENFERKFNMLRYVSGTNKED